MKQYVTTSKRQELIDRVIEDIKTQVYEGDVTVLEEILKYVSTDTLIQSLPEEEWVKFSGQYKGK